MTAPVAPLAQITPDILLKAYACGVFPMSHSADDPDIFWVEPVMRGIMPVGRLHVSRSLARTFRNRAFDIRIDSDFEGVIAGCAARPETWINGRIAALFRALFHAGQVHTVEIWEDGALAGGIYGLALGAAFFGESMFSARRDGSKLAMIALMARLVAGGYRLFDTQFVTAHLISMGALALPQDDYLLELQGALVLPARFGALDPATSRQELLQLATQMS